MQFKLNAEEKADLVKHNMRHAKALKKTTMVSGNGAWKVYYECQTTINIICFQTKKAAMNAAREMSREEEFEGYYLGVLDEINWEYCAYRNGKQAYKNGKQVKN